ncbi:V-set domain-containing T-cell activation inhibitor 1 isoform X2 [Amblyraja radiata]|uniref:V-set domain-containing T-cell activation inhibitor 1 isoform X2 n=1 Tax=Amblyraja radiata TaxID=386614 RepID=UPI0014040764|nr:V-set domain-containing T-cell activation inhibitor 1 isoform X2 [Amblyraja radiata]
MYFKHLVFSILFASADAFTCEPAIDVEIGKDVTFNCTFECDNPCVPWVIWKKDQVAGILYEYKEDKSDVSKQHANYSGRIEVDTSSFKEGKAFLTLKNVEIWDEGKYIVSNSTDNGYGAGFVQLSVWAATPIKLFWNSKMDMLSCQSSGWYPAPTVEWKDKSGNNLNKHSEIIMRETNGHFNVIHNLKVFDKQNQYICSMWHKWMKKEYRAAFSEGTRLIRVDDGKNPSDL